MTGSSILWSACSSDSLDSPEIPKLRAIEWTVEGCPAQGEAFDAVEASLTDIETVLRVQWTSATEEKGAVFFELDGEIHQTSWESQASTDHEALILGVPAHTDVPFVVAGNPDDPHCSSGWAMETGGIPAALPELSLEKSEDETLPGYILAPAITTGQSFLTLIDSQGRYIWAHRHEDLIWRMRMGLQGDSILFNHSATGVDVPGPIYRIGLDGRILQTWQVHGAHRDFVELPDGSVATLSWELQDLPDPVTGSLRTIVGDTLIEVNADGNERQIWSAWDQHSPDLSETMTQGLYADNLEAEEWTHANALTYLESDDSFLISLDAWNAIVKVDRSTGDEQWFLTGGTGGNFDQGETGLISNAHSVRPTENGNLLIFNRNDFASGECAEAVELELDETNSAAWKRWSYASTACQVVTYLGNAIPIPGGERLIVFSTSGQIDRVNAAGELHWQLRADLGFGFGLSDFTSSLYPSTTD